MTYKPKKYLPDEYLRQFIEFYWIATDAQSPYKIHLLPDYRAYLVFLREGTSKYHTTNGNPIKNFNDLKALPYTHIKSHIIKPHIDYNIIETECNLNTVGIQFSLTGAYTLPISKQNKTIIPIDNIFTLKTLETKVIAAQTDKECILILDDYFRRTFSNATKVDSYTINKLKEIDEKIRANTTVTKLSDTMCIGERQLLRIFNNIAGLSTREYCRIKRFRTTLQTILTAMPIGEFDMEEIAESHGYSDTPHMVRDIKQLCGKTPREISDILKTSTLDQSNNIMIYETKNIRYINITK